MVMFMFQPVTLLLLLILSILVYVTTRPEEPMQDKTEYVRKDDVIKLLRDNIEPAAEKQAIGLDISYLIDEVAKLPTIKSDDL